MADRGRGRRKGKGASRSKATPARLLALELCRARRERDAYLRELIDARRVESTLPPEEFAYAQVLAFGATMCEGTLDFAIDRNLDSPRDVKPNVRDCLRISAYELLFLGKPAPVVVDQGVELVRSTARKAAGLANAVLRKLARDASGFPWGDQRADDGAFARLYGVPTWLARALAEQYGREISGRVLSACLRPAPTYLVENPYAPGTRFASDLSAQAVAGLVPLPVSGSLLEIGAGRGTKTLLLQGRALAELGHAADIHTLDVHAFKRDVLEERMREMRVPGVTAHVGDARDLDAVPGLARSFATVFIDAPCSGTGTLRRHPEIRWRLKPSDVESLVALQRQMLAGAAGHVEPGGALVYATCSVLAAENERNVEDFLETEAGSRFERVSLSRDSAAARLMGAGQQDVPFFQTLPTTDGPDGHFAAVLRRVL